MKLDGLVMSLRMIVGVAVLGSVAWACDPAGDPPTQVPLADAEGILEQAYCERMFDCTCDQGRRYEQIADCRDDVGEEIANLRSRAADTGLIYNPSCLGAFVDRLDDLGCAASVESDDDDDDVCTPACAVLHGNVALGGDCRRFDNDSDCAQGLQCSALECDPFGVCSGTCIDSCAGECPGGCTDDQRCDYESRVCEALPQLGDQCSEWGCAPELACRFDVDGSGECVALPRLGQSCEQIQVCADELRCEADPVDGMFVCVAASAIDEPCNGHSDCESGFCPAGYCATLPGKGDSCEGTGACAEGLDCDSETQVCVEGDAIICGISFDAG